MREIPRPIILGIVFLIVVGLIVYLLPVPGVIFTVALVGVVIWWLVTFLL